MPPAVTVVVLSVLPRLKFTILTVSLSTAQPSLGVSAAVHCPAVVLVGALELVGSPPPPTCALFSRVPLALEATLTGKLKTLVPLAAIAVLLVQVITLLAAVQLQLPPLVPPVVTAPFVIVNPVGRTSTIVIVPLLATFPELVTVNE